MLSVRAIYDGRELKFSEKLKITTPHEVIVTFLDEPREDISALEMQEIAMKGGALNFLDNPEEDIYSDNDIKVKY